MRSPVVVLCAVDPVIDVEGDLLALHVPLAHHAHQTAMMEHQVPDTQRVIRTNITSTFSTAAWTRESLQMWKLILRLSLDFPQLSRLKMLFTIVILIDNVNLACYNFLTDTAAVTNSLKVTFGHFHITYNLQLFHLKVFFTDWLIFEC